MERAQDVRTGYMSEANYYQKKKKKKLMKHSEETSCCDRASPKNMPAYYNVKTAQVCAMASKMMPTVSTA